MLGAVSLFMDGLIAGTFFCSALVEHAERNLHAAEWIAYKQAKETVFGALMPLLFGITIFLAVSNAWLHGFSLLLTPGAASLVLALIITGAVHLPLNKKI